jgi:hypothetical protein
MSILVEDDGTLVATAADDSGPSDWFQVYPRSLKAFIRSPRYGLLREMPRGTLQVDLDAAAPDNVVTIVPIGTPFSRRLYDQDPVTIVSPAGVDLGVLTSPQSPEKEADRNQRGVECWVRNPPLERPATGSVQAGNSSPADSQRLGEGPFLWCHLVHWVSSERPIVVRLRLSGEP